MGRESERDGASRGAPACNCGKERSVEEEDIRCRPEENYYENELKIASWWRRKAQPTKGQRLRSYVKGTKESVLAKENLNFKVDGR